MREFSGGANRANASLRSISCPNAAGPKCAAIDKSSETPRSARRLRVRQSRLAPDALGHPFVSGPEVLQLRTFPDTVRGRTRFWPPEGERLPLVLVPVMVLFDEGPPVPSTTNTKRKTFWRLLNAIFTHFGSTEVRTSPDDSIVYLPVHSPLFTRGGGDAIVLIFQNKIVLPD